ncbi:uncharacterized protein [Leptinotarsa decemlineata]|uniref:uncharacterized protein n=1 Tax=Leptinotarsa decemlineata TaxID=7539 RepID=UPI003D30BC8B
MASSTTVFATISVFLCLSTLGSTIKCFQCNSAIDELCIDIAVNDTANPHYKTCEGIHHGHKPFCRKMISYVEHDYEKSYRIVRSCSWMNSENATEDFCKSTDTDYIKKSFCTCFTDGCNSSPKTEVFSWVAIFSTVSVVLLYVIG